VAFTGTAQEGGGGRLTGILTERKVSQEVDTQGENYSVVVNLEGRLGTDLNDVSI